MTKAGWEKAWLTRDSAGGFDGLRPDGPRKTPWALQRIHFKMEYILKYIVRTWAKSSLTIEMGWARQLKLVIGNGRWHFRG